MNLGGTGIDSLKLGSTDVDKVMLGSDEVWSSGGGIPIGSNLQILDTLVLHADDGALEAMAVSPLICISASGKGDIISIDISDTSALVVTNVEGANGDVTCLMLDSGGNAIAITDGAESMTDIVISGSTFTLGDTHDGGYAAVSGVLLDTGYFIGGGNDGATLDLNKVILEDGIGATSMNFFNTHTGNNVVWGTFFDGFNYIDCSDINNPIIGTVTSVPYTFTSLSSRGDNILFAGATDGVYIYDVSIPSAPEEIYFLNTGGSAPHGTAAVGDTLFVRSGTFFMSFDITVLASPTMTSILQESLEPVIRAINLNPGISGTAAFVISGEDTLVSIDIT